MLILVLNQKKVRVCFLLIFVPKILARKHALFIHENVGGNLKKRLTTKNIQENEAISNCKIE